jgi:plasmid stabilization system protein ParE
LEEAETAVDWYARRSIRAAEMLADELDWAIERITQNPREFPVHEFGKRRVVLRRFPHLVVFRLYLGKTPVEVKSSQWPTHIAAPVTGATVWNDLRPFLQELA